MKLQLVRKTGKLSIYETGRKLSSGTFVALKALLRKKIKINIGSSDLGNEDMSAVLARLAYTRHFPGMHYHVNQKKVVFFVLFFFFLPGL